MDFDRDVALLVTIGSGNEELVIGGASYFAVEAVPPARSAELAFTVEDDYQGLGIASILMRHILNIARKNNLTQLEAEVLASNLKTLTVFRRCGLPIAMRHEGSSIHVTLFLGEQLPVA